MSVSYTHLLKKPEFKFMATVMLCYIFSVLLHGEETWITKQNMNRLQNLDIGLLKAFQKSIVDSEPIENVMLPIPDKHKGSVFSIQSTLGMLFKAKYEVLQLIL